ncbi:MAG: nucleotidyltransferase domain-containing protein [Planctomycetes bacterium]|nr:nucleotidyltransferase domain-containing protein [Planctomycetota bacterium]
MDKKIYNTITEYRQRLERLGIRIKKIILYGSGVSKNLRPDSDIDLVVISDSFKNMDTWERLSFLGRARIGINRPMEILGFTDKEYSNESKGTFIGDEVKAKGVAVV